MSTRHSRSTSSVRSWPVDESTWAASTNVPEPRSSHVSVIAASGARWSTKSCAPPSERNDCSTGSSGLRSSRRTSSRPGTRYDVWRSLTTSSSVWNLAVLEKICRSAQYRMRVPVTAFATLPTVSSRDASVNGSKGASGVGPDDGSRKNPGSPRRKAMWCVAPSRSTQTSSRSLKALTTEAPTPWRPAGRGVRAAAELPARVELGHDHLDAAQSRLGLRVHGDAAAGVADLDGVVGMEDDLDPRAVPPERLVHRVVDDLPEAVHEPAGVRGPDVHAGALAHGLEPLEDAEVTRGVVGGCHQVSLGGGAGRPGSASPPFRRAPRPGDANGGAPKGPAASSRLD